MISKDKICESRVMFKEIKRQRDDHPYYLPIYSDDKQKRRSALMTMKSGANYEMAKIIASATGSHLITDIPYRWKEIEIDRSEFNIKNDHWNSFSNAFQSVELKFLNSNSVKY